MSAGQTLGAELSLQVSLQADGRWTFLLHGRSSDEARTHSGGAADLHPGRTPSTASHCLLCPPTVTSCPSLSPPVLPLSLPVLPLSYTVSSCPSLFSCPPLSFTVLLLSSIVLHCHLLSSTVSPCPPLSPPVLHCPPLSSTVLHCLRLSSTVFLLVHLPLPLLKPSLPPARRQPPEGGLHASSGGRRSRATAAALHLLGQRPAGRCRDWPAL